MNWNPRIEKVVNDIQQESKLYKSIHTEKSRELTLIYNRCMLFAIFLGPLATTVSGVGMILFPDGVYYMTITSTILTFLSGILLSYVKFYKIEESSSLHSIAASKYTSLEKNIHRQLQLYKSDRISPQDYLEWLTTTFDELLISSPLIPNVEKKSWEQHEDFG